MRLDELTINWSSVGQYGVPRVFDLGGRRQGICSTIRKQVGQIGKSLLMTMYCRAGKSSDSLGPITKCTGEISDIT